MRQEEVRKHFDQVAPFYSHWKKKSSFYEGAVIRGLRGFVPPGKRILDFGCGTGRVLDALSPSFGVGVDLSPRMIALAKKDFPERKNLHFQTGLKGLRGGFDFILLVDVVEHLPSPEAAFADLRKLAGKRTKLIVSFVGPSWEPILWLLEKLRIKMPEGPHRRLNRAQVVQLAQGAGFKLVQSQGVRILGVLPLSPITILVFKTRGR